MSLSSNSIIHLTHTKSSLEGILKNGLIPHYCKENIEIGDNSYKLGVPMISFCDIPLSKIKDHINKYGEYGIGLTKEWALKNKLNPVVYLEPDSNLSESVNVIINKFLSSGNTETWTSEQNSIADILRYVKNYQNDLVRKGENTPDYRYSDEREWRFVPSYKEKCDMLLSLDLIDTTAKKNKFNKTIASLKLNFEPNDIKYIFVETDADIHDLINILKSVSWSNFTGQDLDRLTTRILTTAQIKSDI